MIVALVVVVALFLGIAIGRLWSLCGTDRLIASMNPDEINALDKRVRARRALKGG